MKIKIIKRVVLSVLAVILVLVAYMFIGGFAAYTKQPKLSDEDIKELDEKNIWGDRNAVERAAIIEDNNEALIERIRLINNAKNEIVMSTFAFHADESGKIMMGALLNAADRGVKVKVLVDGAESWTSMEWNDSFYALSSHKNVEVKLYNVVNPLVPWKSMGRLHDKYLIGDDNIYILGGRNTFNFFLGDYPGHKNYDRDVLVYCEEPDDKTSVSELKSYFEGIWNYEECSYFHNNEKLAQKEDVKNARKDIDNIYSEYCSKYSDRLKDKDYTSQTVQVNGIAILSNPTGYQAKKPVVWYQMCSLMKNADSRVKIHTPYIICNNYMYDSLKEVCDNVDNVTLMTNSVGNNGNPFGAADYYTYKDKILDTGLEVWEYEGGYSYHGKSVLIDDNISIVGSFNMDMRSAYLDTELMLVIDSKEINKMLSDAMDSYEKVSRKANKDGSYYNPYNVTPIEITDKNKRRIKLIKTFIGWSRFLF